MFNETERIMKFSPIFVGYFLLTSLCTSLSLSICIYPSKEKELFFFVVFMLLRYCDSFREFIIVVVALV